MRVDQPGKQRLLAKVNDFTGVARFDLIKFCNINDSIFGKSDRAILDGRSVHRDDGARTNDHCSAVAAVCDGRQPCALELLDALRCEPLQV